MLKDVLYLQDFILSHGHSLSQISILTTDSAAPLAKERDANNILDRNFISVTLAIFIQSFSFTKRELTCSLVYLEELELKEERE